MEFRSCHDPRDEQPCEGGRPAHGEEADRSSNKTYQQHRAASHPIRKFTEERRGKELHDGIDSHQPAVRNLRRAKLFGVQRQDRNEDAKADQVDKDRQENDVEFGTLVRHIGRWARKFGAAAKRVNLNITAVP